MSGLAGSSMLLSGVTRVRCRNAETLSRNRQSASSSRRALTRMAALPLSLDFANDLVSVLRPNLEQSIQALSYFYGVSGDLEQSSAAIIETGLQSLEADVLCAIQNVDPEVRGILEGTAAAAVIAIIAYKEDLLSLSRTPKAEVQLSNSSAKSVPFALLEVEEPSGDVEQELPSLQQTFILPAESPAPALPIHELSTDILHSAAERKEATIQSPVTASSSLTTSTDEKMELQEDLALVPSTSPVALTQVTSNLFEAAQQDKEGVDDETTETEEPLTQQWRALEQEMELPSREQLEESLALLSLSAEDSSLDTEEVEESSTNTLEIRDELEQQTFDEKYLSVVTHFDDGKDDTITTTPIAPAPSATPSLAMASVASSFKSTSPITGSMIESEAEGEEVEFIWPYHADTAELAGTFNEWVPEPMQKEEETWLLKKKLPAGRHHFKYVINGSNWWIDLAKPYERDGVADNNVVEVREKERA